jgi:UDP-N-acetylglucosamine:LPS N-acetylglucosamine transferase
MNRSTHIFDNPISTKTQHKALNAKNKYLKKFGDDSKNHYPLSALNNKTLYAPLGIKNIVCSGDHETIQTDQGIIIGNIRMGFGHYRISMAIASAAHAMGYTPYWFDLHAYQETTGGKVIKHLNALYSMGSRWSQKYPLFNKYYWEPLNSEGFRKLSYNAIDQKVSELMTPIYKELPKDMPYVATHVWPAQAAVHAGMKRVINVIPDNWPMALHLAEGSIHTVQTPSSYLGYKTLKGMDGTKVLQPIPNDQIVYTGHYIDHELVENLPLDCEQRLKRIQTKEPLRILITVGGAGAQREIFAKLIQHMMPLVQEKKLALFINVGDHQHVWEGLIQDVSELKQQATLYFNAWSSTLDLANKALHERIEGIHAFYHEDIFEAVYASNLLMRSSDILITKPSELAFYPIPKLMIKRVGGHEAWGAIRAAEIGDGSIECDQVSYALQMLDLMLTDETLLISMVQAIQKAHQIGIYNGAYEVVKLSVAKP